MKLWPCGFAVFLMVVEAAVVDGEGYSGKCLHYIFRCHPVRRIFRVVVITVHRQTVTADKVVIIAIAVAVFGTDIVMADRSLQTGLIQNHMLVGIGAVAGIAGNISGIDGKHYPNGWKVMALIT